MLDFVTHGFLAGLTEMNPYSVSNPPNLGMDQNRFSKRPRTATSITTIFIYSVAFLLAIC